MLRRHRFSILCLVLAALIGVAAIADHRWKNARSNRAQLAEWYCRHEGTRCGGPSSERIEERWEQRERGYDAAVALLGIAAVALAARGRLRGR